MPTPSSHDRIAATPSSHTSCPPDDDRSSWRSVEMDDTPEETILAAAEVLQQPTPPASGSRAAGSTETRITEQPEVKRMDIEEDNVAHDMLSPMSAEADKQDDTDIHALANTDLGSPSMGYDFSNIRLIPSSPSSFLRAGSKFHGTQQSERQVYDVQVEIKHVDMRESFLCGYLRIQGLTEDHPTLTTYFEGEIIGSKYTFLTQHEDWGSNDKVDLQHWAKFTAFRPFQKAAKKGHFHIPHLAQRENIFMRWKEHFLVPDHRVRTITGASFEGFYYICFNQVQGTIPTARAETRRRSGMLCCDGISMSNE
ncbi:Vesicle-mediated transport protein-like protein Vid24 [Venustampulla echinocandica]|uniref:Vesicle-mediated transport protein-like protein Vid24 n=1 Tax=Venustampulla echinocandica TaxID=2656787 RepID=A0A370U379_9HELO|nr:Vesicle-mediated transport protein-like protein Vid24 [Venustampulla echinocandica]RDL42239.1 Vesicle-mediated transport protein-like protein Vid24 [Venustampulla echinocandica]